MKQKNKIHHNVKVAQSRGDTWRKNLIKGKHESAKNPSKIKLIRLKTGISQEELAKEVGTSTNTLGAIERGIRPVKKERANLISKSLGRKVSQLFRKSESNNDKLVAIK